jgi:uncharacterized protein YwgA
MSIHETIADIVALSGGRLVGRTRIQKTVYLLDTQGLKSGAAYYYYNFGPFSDEVAAGISDGKFAGLLAEKIDQRRSDGSPFSIFETERAAESVTNLGSLKRPEAMRLLGRLSSANSTVLELAATIHWLKFIEKVIDWRAELARRKGAKTGGGRTEMAVALLSDLGISV